MTSTHHSFYIISTHDFSRNSAGSTRMNYYAKALATKNHRVYLISCCSTQLSESHFEEISSNVFVLNEKKKSLGFLDTISFLRRLNAFSDRKGGNKSFLLYPTVFMLFEILSIFYLKFYKKKKIYYELNEVRKYASSHEAPLTISKISYSLEKILFKTIFNVTQPLLYFYDGLVCISTRIENYGRQFNRNTLRIPILTDPDKVLEVATGQFCNKDAFNIGFSGSIDPIKEDLANFIEVIEKLNDNGHRVAFNLCGAVKNTYNEKFTRRTCAGTAINYYGFLDELQLSTFLSQQDLLILPRGFTLQNDYGFSTKLSDYLNHKKMVLVTDISDNALYIKDNVNGFVVPPDDKAAMYEKIKYIMESYDSLESKVVLNALKTSKEDFDYRIYSKKLRNFLK